MSHTILSFRIGIMCVSAEVRILKSSGEFEGKPEEVELLSEYLQHLLEEHEDLSIPVVSVEGNLNVYFRRPVEMNNV